MQTRRSWIAVGTVLVVAVGCVLLLRWLLRDLDLTVVHDLGWKTVLAVIVLSMLGTTLYTVAVYSLIRASGYRTTIAQAYLVLTSTLSLNYVTPVKAGLPLRVYLYSHFMQIPPSAGTALVAMETLLGMLTPAVATALGVIYLFESIPMFLPLALLALLSAIAGAIVFVPVSLATRLAEGLPGQRLTRRAIRFCGEVQRGLRRVPRWVPILLSLLFAANFVVHSLRLHVILLGLGYSLSPVTLFFALTAAVTAGNVSMIPLGLGVRDASLTALLRQAGLPNQIALSVTVIQRLLSPGWPLLLGLISGNILGVSEIVGRTRDTEDSTT